MSIFQVNVRPPCENNTVCYYTLFLKAFCQTKSSRKQLLTLLSSLTLLVFNKYEMADKDVHLCFET